MKDVFDTKNRPEAQVIHMGKHNRNASAPLMTYMPYWADYVPPAFLRTQDLQLITDELHRNFPRREVRLVFPEGKFRVIPNDDGLVCLWRDASKRKISRKLPVPEYHAACIIANILDEDRTVYVPMPASCATEVADGLQLSIVSAGELPCDAAVIPAPASGSGLYAEVPLDAYGRAALVFHEPQRLQVPMEPGLGILAHITSLPSRTGQHIPGTMMDAFRFIDWLADAGCLYWQVLPITPADFTGSPYAGESAFAGNLSLMGEDIDYENIPARHGFRKFVEEQSGWLEPYAAYRALKQRHGMKPWWEWPREHQAYHPGILEGDKALMEAARRCRIEQYAFSVLWDRVREHARKRGVRIIGDMAIYVSHDSADVWAHRDMFQLNGEGQADMVTGCPPGKKLEEGQVWGHPPYDWVKMKEDGYSWWMERLQRAFGMYDIVRLDHFIGFSRYYAIPKGLGGRDGIFFEGPGLDLFRTAAKRFGELPLVAEDLGLVVPSVRALSASTGFPGMAVIQFAGDPLNEARGDGYKIPPGKIAYSGTHDTDTLVGYAYHRYPGEDSFALAREIMDALVACPADVKILQLQDLLELDGYSRMNTPGIVADYNWVWRADPDILERDDVRERLERFSSVAAG